MGILQDLSEALEKGDANKVRELTKHALGENLGPTSILDDGLIAGMNIVGKKFKDHEIYLPDVLMAAKAMTAGMDLLKPFFVGERPKTLGKVVIGTIKGDIHDIGKNLVSSMLQANGFEVFDLGADVKLERFIEKAQAEGADLVCLSALLTTTMLNQKRFIELLGAKGLSGKFKVLVGGAPATRKWAEDIGAQGYAENAALAVKEAKALMGR
jgi:5-methyltetrahydrofolate--homocysteine methyltransferase